MQIVKSATDIETLYTQALERYLGGDGERALRRAYEVGRMALANEIGLLDMAELHHSALHKILCNAPKRDDIAAGFADASQFLAESLSPYEMAYRGYCDAVAGLRSVNETLEKEVKRIAHSVHDEAGQILVAVYLALAEITPELSPALQVKINEVTNLLHQVEDQLRALSHELRPTILDDLGLVPAVRFLTDRASKRFGLSIRIEASLQCRPFPAVETALYRIVQEALNNIVKHSHARNVWVQLDDHGKRMVCSIRDDGIGFHAQTRLTERGKKGLGLIGMQERLSPLGGTLQIDSEPGRGTTLLITLPMEQSHVNSSVAC